MGLARSLKGQARVRGSRSSSNGQQQPYEGFSIVANGTSQVVSPNAVV
jgi:hypothetical protein